MHHVALRPRPLGDHLPAHDRPAERRQRHHVASRSRLRSPIGGFCLRNAGGCGMCVMLGTVGSAYIPFLLRVQSAAGVGGRVQLHCSASRILGRQALTFARRTSRSRAASSTASCSSPPGRTSGPWRKGWPRERHPATGSCRMCGASGLEVHLACQLSTVIKVSAIACWSLVSALIPEEAVYMSRAALFSPCSRPVPLIATCHLGLASAGFGPTTLPSAVPSASCTAASTIRAAAESSSP